MPTAQRPDVLPSFAGSIPTEVATHHVDTTAERELLARRHEHAESERYKLMEAYYSNAIDVTVLRHEQERIGAELRAIESRQATLDATLDDWQEVMDLAIRFSTRCAIAYRRGSDRTTKLFNTAVLDEVHVRDGHVVEAGYKEPFDLLFSRPKFEYDDVVSLGPHNTNQLPTFDGPSLRLGPAVGTHAGNSRGPTFTISSTNPATITP